MEITILNKEKERQCLTCGDTGEELVIAARDNDGNVYYLCKTALRDAVRSHVQKWNK